MSQRASWPDGTTCCDENAADASAGPCALRRASRASALSVAPLGCPQHISPCGLSPPRGNYPDGRRSYCAGIATSQRGDWHDDTRNLGLQWPDQNHFGELAPTLVPTIWPALLPIQGHVPVVDPVTDHSQRLVDLLPALQSSHRHATLPQERMGSRMNHGAPNRTDCYPSGTQRATLTSTAKADCMKRLSDLATARTRQTDT